MSNCVHVEAIVPAVENPGVGAGGTDAWKCRQCSVNESTWLCLSCGATHCGGEIKSHHLRHFEITKHPFALELETQFLFCFPCQSFVDVETNGGDVKIYRQIIPLMMFDHSHEEKTSLRRSTRSAAQNKANATHNNNVSGVKSQLPRYSSVVKFRRACILKRAFSAWRNSIASANYIPEPTPKETREEIDSSKSVETAEKKMCKTLLNTAAVSKNGTSRTRKRAICATAETSVEIETKQQRSSSILTGLGNVGNTCYMNAVLQILCNLDEFRDRFLRICPVHLSPSLPHGDMVNGKSREMRHFQGTSIFAETTTTDSPSQKRLTSEVHRLLGVMWSGNLSLVIPDGFMQAVWQAVPAFRGYHQHDAQEFMTEMLDKLSDEIPANCEVGNEEENVNGNNPELNDGFGGAVKDLVKSLFHGQLTSQVTCLTCKRHSPRSELFSDLSLEFPERFQNCRLTNLNLALDACHVSEMLSTFTSTESLGNVYQCENCNKKVNHTRSRHHILTTPAEKRILLSGLPKILRLHLKRFRWSGRSRREKISIHVQFDEIIDVRDSCGSTVSMRESTRYRLCGLIMHHGRGFHSGHYTAYCWNSKGKLWLHCNDARLEIVPFSHVLAAQAYILFYSKMEDSGDSQLE